MAGGEQLPAELGGLHAPVADRGDGAADGLGELAQQRGDGGLRHAQLLRGARDATQAHGGLEREQLREESVAEETSEAGAGHKKTFVTLRWQRSR